MISTIDYPDDPIDSDDFVTLNSPFDHNALSSLARIVISTRKKHVMT